MVRILNSKKKKSAAPNLSRLSDSELASLMDKAKQESHRRFHDTINSTGGRSRWLVAFSCLCLGFFLVLFERTLFDNDSNIHKSTLNKTMSQDDDVADLMHDDIVELVHDHNPETEIEEAEEEAEEEQPQEEVGLPINIADFPLNKADDETKEKSLGQGTRPKVRYQYTPRSALNDAAKKEELTQQWGSWTLTDPKRDQRPTHDYAKDFPHRDVPWDKFPSNAWQTDPEYLSQFLPESIALVERAMEAIMAEYGWSKHDLPDKDFETRYNASAFYYEPINPRERSVDKGKGYVGDTLGGWYSTSYPEGLKRRLMHSLLTEDTFTMVMGGHSAAAGHGNHFSQSYTLQFFKILEPIMARLGVKLHAMNSGYGGLGTGQSAMAAGDLYGREIDLYVWDSQMTENSNEAYEMFARQGLLAGNRIPVLLGGMKAVLTKLEKDIDIEVGQFGHGLDAMPEVTDAQQAESIIWAARYLKCTGEMHGECRAKEYNGTCWIERDDYTPIRKQRNEPGGRASWHPGFKQHAVKARVIAFPILQALLAGLKEWESSPNKQLPVEKWHVTDHYENIRTKLNNLPHGFDEGGGYCYNYNELPWKEFCTIPFHGVSEMTPRANPRETAIRNIMNPAYNGHKPVPQESVYNPPDVFNPILHVPEGEFDYMAVVENGVEYPEILVFDNSPLPAGYLKTNNKLIPLGIPGIEPGIGWGCDCNTNPDECDGSYDGFCNRGEDQDCLLYGHNDHRGGLLFDSYSGWGVFTIPNVKLGIILIRLEWWGGANKNKVTDGWGSENNADPHFSGRRRLQMTNAARTQRRLGAPSWDEETIDEHPERKLGGAGLCDDFKFELAVNGKITTYNTTEYMTVAQYAVQRVVPIMVALDDKELTGGEPTDIEVALRITGCQRTNTLSLSNFYWA